MRNKVPYLISGQHWQDRKHWLRRRLVNIFGRLDRNVGRAESARETSARSDFGLRSRVSLDKQ